MRVPKATAITLTSPTFVAADRVTPTDCSSTPTCTVTREDGTALTAATVTSAGTGTGLYTAAITTTHTSQCDQLAIVWTGTVSSQQQTYTSTLEVVGAHYCTLPELRELDGLDEARFPASLLEEIRDEYEDAVERICGVAFVRRYQRDLFAGDGTGFVQLTKRQPATLLSVVVNGTSQTITNAFDIEGDNSRRVYWRSQPFPYPGNTYGINNVAVAYEHGYAAPPPALRREVMKAIRAEAFASVSTESYSVISETFDGRTLRFSTPDPDKGRYTGIISLDPVLNALMENVGIY